MTAQFKKFAISGLRWTLGVVVLLESLHFALSVSSIHHVVQMGLPEWIPTVLGGGEVIAALLFLVPAARLVGGYFLLFIFAIAIVIHFLHGEFDVGALLVYAMAVIVCMAHSNTEAAEMSHDG